MISPIAYAFDRQRIVVADEESVTTAMIVATLRRDGHCVALDRGALSAPYAALSECHLLISSLEAEAVARIDLLDDLRQRVPALSILYVTDGIGSPANPEHALPDDVAVLHVPFTTGELQAAVGRLLPKLRAGTILARAVGDPGTTRGPTVPAKADGRAGSHG